MDYKSTTTWKKDPVVPQYLNFISAKRNILHIHINIILDFNVLTSSSIQLNKPSLSLKSK